MRNLSNLLSSILNRTDQKKLVNYLQNYFDNKFGKGAYTLSLKPSRFDSDGVEVEYY